jgi:hypothetical protein
VNRPGVTGKPLFLALHNVASFQDSLYVSHLCSVARQSVAGLPCDRMYERAKAGRVAVSQQRNGGYVLRS